jgi:hypothetical protein
MVSRHVGNPGASDNWVQPHQEITPAVMHRFRRLQSLLPLECVPACRVKNGSNSHFIHHSVIPPCKSPKSHITHVVISFYPTRQWTLKAHCIVNCVKDQAVLSRGVHTVGRQSQWFDPDADDLAQTLESDIVDRSASSSQSCVLAGWRGVQQVERVSFTRLEAGLAIARTNEESA